MCLGTGEMSKREQKSLWGVENPKGKIFFAGQLIRNKSKEKMLVARGE